MESGDNKMIMEVELQTDNVTTPDPPPCAKNNTDQQGQQQQQQPQQTQGPAQAGQLLGQAELHNQDDDKFVYTCNSCNKSLDTRYVQYSIMIIIVCLIRIKNCQYVASFFFCLFFFRYHCNQCDDFDLCFVCYSREGHPHRLEKFGFDLRGTAEAASADKNGNPDRVTAIQRCINSLMHACQCRDTNCQSPSCHKMKRVVSHTRQCKRKSQGGCPICKQLIALCCYHAKVCQDAKCPVYFCQNIKQKLRQEAAMMRQRMAQMNAGMNHNMSNHNDANVPQKGVPQQHQIQQQVLPQVQQQQAPQQQQQEQQEMETILSSPGVLEAVKKVQEEVLQQQQSFGKGNPGNPGMVGPVGAGVALLTNSTMIIQHQTQDQQGPMMQDGNPQQQQWQQDTVVIDKDETETISEDLEMMNIDETDLEPKTDDDTFDDWVFL